MWDKQHYVDTLKIKTGRKSARKVCRDHIWGVIMTTHTHFKCIWVLKVKFWSLKIWIFSSASDQARILKKLHYKFFLIFFINFLQKSIFNGR